MRNFWKAIVNYFHERLSPTTVITEAEVEVIEQEPNWLEIMTGEADMPQQAKDETEHIMQIKQVEIRNDELNESYQEKLPQPIQELIIALPSGGRVIFDREKLMETGFIETVPVIGLKFFVESSNVKAFSFYPDNENSTLVITYNTKGEDRVYMYRGDAIIVELMDYLVSADSAGEAVWDRIRVRNGKWGAYNFDHHDGIEYSRIEQDLGEYL